MFSVIRSLTNQRKTVYAKSQTQKVNVRVTKSFQNSQIRVTVNLVEKISIGWIQGTHQSVHHDVSVNVEILRV